MALLKTLTIDNLKWVFFIAMPFGIAAGRTGGEVCLSAIAVLFVLELLVKPEKRAALRTPWFVAAALFWGYINIRGLFVHKPLTALGTTLPWIRYPLFAIGVSLIFDQNEKLKKIFFYALSIVILFLASDAFYQYLTGKDFAFGHHGVGRLTGSFRRPIVGMVMLSLFFPLVGYWHHRVKKNVFLFCLFLIVCAFVSLVVFLSGERMAFLLLLFGSGIYFFFHISKKRFFILIAITLGASLTLLTTPMQQLLETTQKFFQKPAQDIISKPAQAIASTISTKLYAAQQRQVNQSLQVITQYKETPYGKLVMEGLRLGKGALLFGIGPEQFREKTLLNDKGLALEEAPTHIWRHPHNIYVDIFCSLGLFGCTLFLWMLFQLFSHAYHHYKSSEQQSYWREGAMINMLLRVWPIAATTSFFASWHAIPFWLTVALAISLKPYKEKTP